MDIKRMIVFKEGFRKILCVLKGRDVYIMEEALKLVFQKIRTIYSAVLI